MEAINTNSDHGTKLVETSLMNKEFTELAYDHQLIEYNSAAHILSVQSGSKELFVSYRLAAALAFIALSMQPSDFDKLKTPEGFDVFGKRDRAFKKNRDRGYAFVCLVFNGGPYNGDEGKYVDRCLSNSNLRSAANILEDANDYLSNPIYFADGNEATSHFFRESAMGGEIVSRYESREQYLLTLEMLNECKNFFPPFMDSECNFIEFNSGRLDEYKPSLMHDFSDKLRDYTQNLMTGYHGFESEE